MGNTFTTADLVSFGNYVSSIERKQAFAATDHHEFANLGIYTPTISEKLRDVHDADLANWKHANGHTHHPDEA